jgi:hypothetical protein
MTTVIETLKNNPDKKYKYVGTLYGSDGFSATGLEFAETLASAGAEYGLESNEGNDDRISTHGEVQFIVEEKSAGRPAFYGETMKQTAFRFPSEQIEFINKNGGAEYLRRLIEYEINKSSFGSVIYQGREYILTCQAYQSNRVFSGWFGDAEEGESYTDEWEATATDRQGNQFAVVWQWEIVKGEEPEDGGDLPFRDSNIVKVKEQ